MAGPADSLNQPPAQSGPTPVNPPGSQGLAGTEFAELGKEIAELRRQMDQGKVSAKELAQSQANLIDNQQALSSLRTKEMAAASRLAHQIADLTLTTTDTTEGNKEYQTQLGDLTKKLKAAREQVEDIGKAYTANSNALRTVVKYGEEKAKTEEKQGALSKQLSARAAGVGNAMQKSIGPMGDLIKVGLNLSTKIPLIGGALGAIGGFLSGPIVGAALLVGSVASQVFKTATRESTTFANTYGTALGFAIAQQNAFKKSISAWGWATFDVSKIQALGSATMKAGAFDAYAANRMAGREFGTVGAASVALAGRLGAASLTMMQMGNVLGMTEQQSGELLATFATGMGAFDASAAAANTDLHATINTFLKMNSATGLALPNLIKFISDVSEQTLGTGITFKTVAAQTTMAMKAIADYGMRVEGLNNKFLSTSVGMEKTVAALYGMGSAMSASTVYGYQLAAGLASAKNPMQGIIDAASATPLEATLSQQKAYAKAGMSVPDQIVAMLTTGQISKKFAKTFEGVIGDPAAMRALNVAAKAKDEAGIAAAFTNLPKDMADKLSTMSNEKQFARDPMDQLVDLSKNANTLLATIATNSVKAAGGSQTESQGAKTGMAKANRHLGGGNR